MNDLRNGIIDINGFLVGPETTVEELEAHLGIPAKQGSINQKYAFWDMGDQIFVNDGINFKVFMSFTNSKIDDIRLLPQFPEIAAKHNLKGTREELLSYYREVRAVLNTWLEKQLGEPSYEDADVTEYQLNSIFVSTCAYIDERSRDHEVRGGRVRISYV